MVAGPTALLVPLAAAVIAGMESLPLAVAAAVGIDVVQQAVLWSYPRSSSVDVALFAAVVLAVVVRRRTLARRGGDQSLGTLTTARDRPLPHALRRLRSVQLARLGTLVVVLAAAAFVPVALSAPRVTILTAIVIYSLVAVSMVVLLGWAGQLSLGQFAFVGIGASVTGALLVHAGADLLLAVLAAAGVGGVAAVVLGLPSLRVPGLFLGVVTMAFAVPVSTFLLDSSYFPTLTPELVPRPVLFDRIDLSSPLALYEVCLVVLVLAMVLARNFRTSRIGRAVLAVRDNDRAAAAFGIAPWRVRLVAFTFSGALAGIAGGLETLNLRGVPFSGFNPEESIVVFTMVVVGGMGSLTGAVLGAAYVEAAQYFLSGGAQLLATGAGLLVLLMVLPGGLGEMVGRGRDRLLRLAARRAQVEVPVLERQAHEPPTDRPEGRRSHEGLLDVLPAGAALECVGVDAAYGDLQVLFGAELTVRAGQVVALLGTNGSGKSTFLRTIAGVLPATGGRILLGGQDVTRAPAGTRVRQGLAMVPGGRGVFPGLTVAENLRVAAWPVRHDRRAAATRTERVLDLFPALRRRIDVPAGLLSGGEQQMLTLAQALMGEPSVLLVDELSLGLAPTVVAQLLEVLRQLAQAGTAIVVVEQSINVAAAIAPTAIFLERGQVRFTGATSTLAERRDVARSVFLGPALGARPPADADTADRRGRCTSDERDGHPTAAVTEDAARLVLRGVSVRFGGVDALTDVSLAARPGEILAIIGANGAGKTTLFDVASGFVAPSAGRILVHGIDVTAASPAARATLGLGRLFQDARLFPGLTVAETVAAAFERHATVRDPLATTFRLGDARQSEQDIAEGTEALLHELGLTGYRDAFVGELSTGTRRMVELACTLAHRPTVLLADEPSSGIAQREVEALGQLLVQVRDATGATLLVIEHDMPMLSSIAERMICLHLGRVLAEGSPATVLGDDAVIAAYLGTDELAVARSG